MKIAILGAAGVGATLGKRFADIGHEIYFGVLNPPKHTDKTSFATIGTAADATKVADLIVLAIPFAKVADAIANCGDISGKIIVDCTNPLRMVDGELGLSIGFDTSAAEQIAEIAGGAKIVKCFNQTGVVNMDKPAYDNGKAVQFVCGDDAEARETVRKLAESIGFDAIDAGELKNARLL